MNKEVQKSYGLTLSPSFAASKGIQGVEGAGTFSNQEVMKKAKSALSGSQKYFSWAVRYHMRTQATVDLSRAQVTESFREKVIGLTPESDYLYYKQIYTIFGTHFIKTAEIGGQSESFMETDKCYAETVSSTELNKCQEYELEGKFTAAEVNSVGGSGEYEHCENAASGEEASSSSSSMSFSEVTLGGNPSQLRCGPLGGRWENYISSECLTLDNAATFPSQLGGIWTLFNLAGNDDVMVLDNAEKFFYQFLMEGADMIAADSGEDSFNPADCPGVDTEEWDSSRSVFFFFVACMLS
jgi:hypothetical protein